MCHGRIYTIRSIHPITGPSDLVIVRSWAERTETYMVTLRPSTVTTQTTPIIHTQTTQRSINDFSEKKLSNSHLCTLNEYNAVDGIHVRVLWSHTRPVTVKYGSFEPKYPSAIYFNIYEWTVLLLLLLVVVVVVVVFAAGVVP